MRSVSTPGRSSSELDNCDGVDPTGAEDLTEPSSNRVGRLAIPAEHLIDLGKSLPEEHDEQLNVERVLLGDSMNSRGEHGSRLVQQADDRRQRTRRPFGDLVTETGNP